MTSKPKQQTSGPPTTEKVHYGKGGVDQARLKKAWYQCSQADMPSAVFSHARHIKDRQIQRRYELGLYQQLYNNFAGIYVGNMADSNRTQFVNQTLSINVIKSCCDTWTARIAKAKPRVYILPNEGDDRLVRKADNLTKFLDGVRELSNLEANSQFVVRDAAIYGTGFLLHKVWDNRPITHVVKVDEVLIDQTNGIYPEEESLEFGYDHIWDKDELIDRYPSFAKEINSARMSWRGDQSYLSDLNKVLVVEFWRRATMPGKPGKHVMCISGACLEFEDYPYTYLPSQKYFFSPPTYGPFGEGIASALRGKQWLLANMMQSIAKSCDLFAVPRVFIPKSAGLSQNVLDNDISVHLVNSAEGIQFVTPQAMGNGVFEFAQWVYETSFQEIGLSQMSTQSVKPAGLNSEPAINTYLNVETERFALNAQDFERLYVDAGKRQLDLAAALYKGKKVNTRVKAPGFAFISKVNWKDASLEEDQYSMKAYPTNMLAQDPAARLEQTMQLMNSKIMPPDVAISQLKLPVFRDWADEMTASRDNIRMCLSLIIDKQSYHAPDPIADINLAVSMSQSAVLRSEYNEDAPEVTDMLRRWMNDALQVQADRQQKAMQQQQVAQQMQGQQAQQQAAPQQPAAPPPPPTGPAA